MLVRILETVARAKGEIGRRMVTGAHTHAVVQVKIYNEREKERKRMEKLKG